MGGWDRVMKVKVKVKVGGVVVSFRPVLLTNPQACGVTRYAPENGTLEPLASSKVKAMLYLRRQIPRRR